MNDLNTLFRRDSAFSSASACASLTAGGNCIGVLRAMLRGTTASISALRDSGPITHSMCRCSSASGPMWRVANNESSSSSERGVRADINMERRCGAERRSEVLEQLVVGGRIHQFVELLHVRDVHLEEPAVAHWVAVDE